MTSAPGVLSLSLVLLAQKSNNVFCTADCNTIDISMVIHSNTFTCLGSEFTTLLRARPTNAHLGIHSVSGVGRRVSKLFKNTIFTDICKYRLPQ